MATATTKTTHTIEVSPTELKLIREGLSNLLPANHCLPNESELIDLMDVLEEEATLTLR